LLRKRIMEVSSNHLLLQIESNSFILSIIRFYDNDKNRSDYLNLERPGARLRNTYWQEKCTLYRIQYPDHNH
jgi:hypothetical protein